MSYQKLQEKYQEIGDLEHALAILGWDEAVMMSSGGGMIRANSLATLSAHVHRLKSDPDNEALLGEATGDNSLNEWQRANLDQMQRDWVIARAVPEDLVVALSKASSNCEQNWRYLRAENDWKAIEPLLREVLDLTREKANCLSEAQGVRPYDALLDLYQPGLGQASIDPVFDDLADFLPGFVDKVLDQQTPPLAMPKKISEDKQKSLALTLMHKIGFAFERGRLDTSHHPFCGGVPDDTRITTRYNKDNFLDSLMAVLHETGHALYEQGLPVDWRGQPVGAALGMAMHESQSLLMEMQVCRGKEFLNFAAPYMRRELAGGDHEAAAFTAENLHAHSIRVSRGLIRVYADELTYPLHVILRYELEKDLLSGTLDVSDLPEAWDTRMRGYLGVSTLGNDKDGCMQDVHWYAGLVGYFPTYSLGAITAAQIFASAVKDNVDIKPGIERGDFKPLLGWLRRNVHGKGCLLSADQLLNDITGASLGTQAFKQHLQNRYMQN